MPTHLHRRCETHCQSGISDPHRGHHSSANMPYNWPTVSNSEDRQVFLKLIVGHLSPIPVPLDSLVFDEGIENVVAEGLSHDLTPLSKFNGIPQAAGKYPTYSPTSRLVSSPICI